MLKIKQLKRRERKSEVFLLFTKMYKLYIKQIKKHCVSHLCFLNACFVSATLLSFTRVHNYIYKIDYDSQTQPNK